MRYYCCNKFCGRLLFIILISSMISACDRYHFSPHCADEKRLIFGSGCPAIELLRPSDGHKDEQQMTASQHGKTKKEPKL